MSVEVLATVNPGNKGDQVLVRYDGRHYVVSSATVLGVPETLVFRANKDGEITNWGEVAGGKHMSREEAIEDLGHTKFDEHGDVIYG